MTAANFTAALFLSGLVSTGAMAAAPVEVSYTFKLQPGGSKTIPLPVVGAPITVNAALSSNNGAVQTPSALISAVVSTDPTAKQLTWIGTNGDGSQTAGNTLTTSPPTVASFAFNNAVVTATPNTGAGTLTFTQSSTSTTGAIFYYVRLIY